MTLKQVHIARTAGGWQVSVIQEPNPGKDIYPGKVPLTFKSWGEVVDFLRGLVISR